MSSNSELLENLIKPLVRFLATAMKFVDHVYIVWKIAGIKVIFLLPTIFYAIEDVFTPNGKNKLCLVTVFCFITNFDCR